MKIPSFLVLAVLAGVTAAPVSAQTLVYDNTKHVRTNLVYKFSREYGDEVFLGAGNRSLSSFTFQYFGEFNPTNSPNATAQLRIYKNDGKDGIPGPQTAFMPKTLLFESSSLTVLPGFNTVTLDLPFVTVPESFTWTVRFAGLTFSSTDSAGLVLADPPTVGAKLPQGRVGSFWDAWIKNDPNNAESWSLINFGFRPGDPKASFYARVFAVPDATSWALPESFSRGRDGKVRFRVKTRPGRRFLVQVSEDFKNWRPWRESTASASVTEFEDETGETEMRFYRVIERSASLVPGSLSINDQKKTRFRVASTPGRDFAVQVSENLSEWREWRVVSATELETEVVDESPDPTARFYRVEER